MSCRGLAKRRKSPTSVTTVMAQIAATPRKAWIASTTGANDHPGNKPIICCSNRERRSSACSMARINSSKTIC